MPLGDFQGSGAREYGDGSEWYVEGAEVLEGDAEDVGDGRRRRRVVLGRWRACRCEGRAREEAQGYAPTRLSMGRMVAAWIARRAAPVIAAVGMSCVTFDRGEDGACERRRKKRCREAARAARLAALQTINWRETGWEWEESGCERCESGSQCKRAGRRAATQGRAVEKRGGRAVQKARQDRETLKVRRDEVVTKDRLIRKRGSRQTCANRRVACAVCAAAGSWLQQGGGGGGVLCRGQCCADPWRTRPSGVLSCEGPTDGEEVVGDRSHNRDELKYPGSGKQTCTAGDGRYKHVPDTRAKKLRYLADVVCRRRPVSCGSLCNTFEAEKREGKRWRVAVRHCLSYGYVGAGGHWPRENRNLERWHVERELGYTQFCSIIMPVVRWKRKLVGKRAEKGQEKCSA
ncbi:hypothetical protein B0H19DRAFT_1075884 [Mycena capillaripes]|nr:hypothetical protein B0H19DRAFT_1075884 [Mycena capillaripes]